MFLLKQNQLSDYEVSKVLRACALEILPPFLSKYTKSHKVKGESKRKTRGENPIGDEDTFNIIYLIKVEIL